MTFDLLDWEAVNKIKDNSPQQFCLWVTNHDSKFCGTKTMLHRWVVETYVLCPGCMTLVLQEGARHQLHCSDKEKEGFFDKDVL